MSQNAGRVITRYVRDASGNVMAVYQADTLSERPIYGSSRLGNLSYASKPGYRTVGHKQYELSNHLGNVMAVVSDRIRMKTDSTWTQVLSRTDYYPFGLEMTGRTESNTYRYGFNGKEKDPSGQWSNQSHYDYGFRIYNPTIGKFLSVDPLTSSYPMLTPYQFASNTPIQAIDLDGLEGFHYTLNLDEDRPKPRLTRVEDIIEYGDHRNRSLMEKTKVIIRRQEYYVTATYQDYDVTDFLAVPIKRNFTKQFDSREFAENATGTDFQSEIELEAYSRSFWQGFVGGIGSRPSNRNKSSSISTSKENSTNTNPRRPYLRQSTIEEVWKQNQNEYGNVVDPTGKIIFWDRAKPRGEQWHMGHRPGYEYFRDWNLFKNGGLNWDQMKERYNLPDRYRPELPSTNQSHKFEKKD